MKSTSHLPSLQSNLLGYFQQLLSVSTRKVKSNLMGYFVAGAVSVSPVMAHYHNADDTERATVATAATPAVNLLSPEQQQVQEAIVADALETNVGYEFLGHLCDDHGGRLTGSTGNQTALLDTLHQLQAMGVDARLQTFKMPGWVRQDDEAVMVAPINRKLRAVTLSYVEPHAPFEADVVYLGNGSDETLKDLDTKGKIGLLAPNAMQRRGGYNEYAESLGLKAIMRTCRVGGGQLLCRTGSFQGEPIKVPVYCVTQEEGKWMQRSLARGIAVRVRLHTRSFNQEIETANIVATFPGRTADTVIVGAHFDSWDLGQGAIDNGLGTAQVFALAKLLQDHAPQNLRTVELVWFNGEEQGLWGSRMHVPTLKDRPVAAMVNLDMVGFPKSVNALGSAELIPVLQQFDASLGERKLEKGVDNVNWFGSDHTPYQLAGIPSITFGAFIEPDVVRYYHDFGDTFDKIDPKMLAESAATIAALTYQLANTPELPTKRLSREEIIALFENAKLVERMRASGIWPFGDDPVASEAAK